ncbi:MAG: 4Fe-4S binding protein [Candidatus Thermoplasmatota archaeon]|nr:4Fe-4S binding protein [Candidatus Thermoplasmatota archaeon]
MTGPIRAAVVVCGDWGASGEIEGWTIEDGVELRVVEGLCQQPGQLREPLEGSGVDRLVLGLHVDRYGLADFQTEARKLGLDALGLEIIHLDGHGLERGKRRLRAALARARAFAGSRPEHAKLISARKVSRRALLRLSFSEYLAAPAIDPTTCASGIGCNACAEICPQDALMWENGRMEYDKGKCWPCGLCMTACPTGAILNPAFTPSQVEAEIRSLLDTGSAGLTGIVFHCQYGSPPQTGEGWVPVVLPCAGMATPPWLLAPLVIGASAVSAIPCPPECPAQQSWRIAGHVRYCRALLHELGTAEDLVSLTAVMEPPPRLEIEAADVEDPFGYGRGPAILDQLTRMFTTDRVWLEEPRSPLGLVTIGEACTACGMCGESCPPGALVAEVHDDQFVLTFDHALCVACNQCLPRCPEIAQGAIKLQKALDTDLLRAGRRVLHEGTILRCESCGAPISSVEMMDRIGELLGEEQAGLMPVLSRSCSDCRMKMAE